MENFGKFCFGALALVTSILIQAYVVMKMWEWFIAGVFGIQVITLIQAAGITLLVTYLRMKAKKSDEETTFKTFITSFVMSICMSAFALLLAYIIHLFM